MIKLYYPKELYDSEQRSAWFELLKSKERFERDGKEIDARIQQEIEWVDTIDKTDVCILPMYWNYYYNKGNHSKAIDFCEQAALFNKKVLSHSAGDLGISVPVDSHVKVYRQSGYRSKLKSNEICAPFFLSDPVGKFIETEQELLRRKATENPILGFCGMAPHGLKTGLKERLQIAYRNGKTWLGKTHEDSQHILSSSNLRFKALSVFEKSKNFSTNYIIRKRYRGGEQSPENRQKTTLEYYNNQRDSDLILCVRGVGNFSLRFYESLAMGRIPVFIDTDSPLPAIQGKDWNAYIIIVDSKKMKEAPDIAMKWLKGKDLDKQKMLNRQLWLTHFRLDNFWLNELSLLNK